MNAKQWLLVGGVAAFVLYLLYQKSQQTAGASANIQAGTMPAGAVTLKPVVPVQPISPLVINMNPDLPIIPSAVGTPLDPATVASGGILQSDPYTIWN